MALQTNLNNKDKKTIALVLFAALIFAVAWFLIRPTVTSIMNTNDRIEEAERTQTEYRNKLIYLTSAEELYGKAVDDLKESTKDYYEIMDSSEIDRMVTSYVLQSGLFAESLNIKMPDMAVDESPYLYSTISDSDYSVTTNAGSGADTLLSTYSNAKSNASSTKSSGIQCVSISLTMTGSKAACQSLIDDLCTKPAVRITSFEWGKVDPVEQIDPVTGNVKLVDSGKVRLRIDVNLYMADVADYESAVTDAVAGVEG